MNKKNKIINYEPSRITKKEQLVPEEIFTLEDPNIMRCYDHFADRYSNRYKNNILTYHSYISVWVKYIRGNEVHRDDMNIWTTIGHYIKDKHVFEVIYKKINRYNIYVPVTIYEITKHSIKCQKYRRFIKNKQENYEK